MKKVKRTWSQVAVLERFAVDLYEIGFLADKDLSSSSCGCCRRKRELLHKVEAALKRAK